MTPGGDPPASPSAGSFVPGVPGPAIQPASATVRTRRAVRVGRDIGLISALRCITVLITTIVFLAILRGFTAGLLADRVERGDTNIKRGARYLEVANPGEHSAAADPAGGRRSSVDRFRQRGSKPRSLNCPCSGMESCVVPSHAVGGAG